MVRAKKDKKSNLGGALKKQGITKPKRDREAYYNPIDTTEKTEKFTKFQDNLVSITEQNDLQSFLDQAQLSNQEFVTERTRLRNLILQNNTEQEEPVDSEDENPLLKQLTETELANIRKTMLTLPRRPEWTRTMTKEELTQKENEAFLTWRRSMAILEEGQTNMGELTPFEKNLEFWRQLWRVVERSDIVVQILDARNPLLFYSPDLTKYTTEIAERTNVCKKSLLLMNKADLLSDEQINYWREYFKNQNDEHLSEIIFFSALDMMKELEEEREDEEQNTEVVKKEIRNGICDVDMLIDNIISHLEPEHKSNPKKPPTVGFVGYPNVGKSSTINSILGKKCVSVSSTPGKTKHYQTMLLEADNLMLCDCPGLVLPNTATSKAELVINGILPIDQLRDWRDPVVTLCKLVAAKAFESRYGINVTGESELEKSLGKSNKDYTTAPRLLVNLAKSKGFAVKGRPDESRAARLVLKDFFNGNLLYCKPPPNITETESDHFLLSGNAVQIDTTENVSCTTQTVENPVTVIDTPHFDEKFFKEREIKVMQRGKISLPGMLPDKKANRTKNKNKREKVRRLRQKEEDDDLY